MSGHNVSIDGMSVKELKAFITENGGDTSDCVEKEDLRRRANEIQAKNLKKATSGSVTSPKPPSASAPNAIKSPNASAASSSPTISAAPPAHRKSASFKSMMGFTSSSSATSSPKATSATANSSAATSPDSAANTPSSSSSGRKGLSVFRAKKFIASAIGETKAGRATVIKIIGEDGDIIIQALKSTATHIDDKPTAKEKKQEMIKFFLKAYNLYTHKDLKVEDMLPLRDPFQMQAERFVAACESGTRGQRNPSRLVKGFNQIHDLVMTLMKPHIQEKNQEILSGLFKYYGSERFIGALLNDPDLDGECTAIEDALRAVLLPLPSILDDEASKDDIARSQAFVRLIQHPNLEQFVDHPKLAGMIQGWLDEGKTKCSKHALRFLMAVRGYEKTSSRNILKIRAPKIYDQFLAKGAKNEIEGLDPDLLKAVQNNIDDDHCTMSLFHDVLHAVLGKFTEEFKENFLTSKAFIELKTASLKELSEMSTNHN